MEYTIGYLNGLFAAFQMVAGVFAGWKIFQRSEYSKRYNDSGYMFGLFTVFMGVISWIFLSFGILDMAYLSAAEHFKFSWQVEAAAQLQYMKLYPAAYICAQVILVINVRRKDIPWNQLRPKKKTGLQLVVRND
jgi:hypothetical protein